MSINTLMWVSHKFSDLTGKTIVSITDTCANKNNNTLINANLIEFKCLDGSIYRLGHKSICCDDHYIENICGDLSDILNTPILLAEEVYSKDRPEDNEYFFMQWCFYKLSTIKGSITIRWMETYQRPCDNNYCYSSEVHFSKVRMEN